MFSALAKIKKKGLLPEDRGLTREKLQPIIEEEEGL
jgi:hypothetical protein